ncbi:MAG TPA: hypothetical protein VK695_14555 [Steroidobacteraceae bacterium]|jgi:hypothetical protein|nr:hypothetical protein [Steroidobacteraceae bacterium]
MNAVSVLYRDFTCAAVAALITLVLGMAFVQSTSVSPAAQASTAQSRGV